MVSRHSIPSGSHSRRYWNTTAQTRSALSKSPFGNSRAQSNLAQAPALFSGGVVALFSPRASLRTSGKIRRACKQATWTDPSLARRYHSLNVWVECVNHGPVLDILDFDDCDLQTDKSAHSRPSQASEGRWPRALANAGILDAADDARTPSLARHSHHNRSHFELP